MSAFLIFKWAISVDLWLDGRALQPSNHIKMCFIPVYLIQTKLCNYLPSISRITLIFLLIKIITFDNFKPLLQVRKAQS